MRERPAAARLGPGQTLAGRYRIDRILGQGGMGAVYLASDERLPRAWAVKEMALPSGDPAERAAAVAAFRAEAHLLSQLEHPNLPRITDFFSEGGREYLVMDFVPGETLEDRIAREQRLPVQDVLDIAVQVTEVLDYLHRRPRPVIFRDLKPANIMVTPEGRVKLIDFGIARFFSRHKTSDTRALGTPGYAAPEQYGRGQSDARTDLYALGATLHHALSGVDPSAEPFKFAPLRELRPEVPEALDEIVRRAVALNPEERYPSVAAFRDALAGLREDPEIYTHLPQSLRTGVLPPPPLVRFEPGEVKAGPLKKGALYRRKAVLRGRADGRLRCTEPWIRVEPRRVQGKDVPLEVVLSTGRLVDGGRFAGRVIYEGAHGPREMAVEVEVEPVHVTFWSLALAFVMTLVSFLPLLGYAGAAAVWVMYLATPRQERAALRVFAILAALSSLAWTGLGLFALVLKMGLASPGA